MKKLILLSMTSLFVLATLLSSCCSPCEKECEPGCKKACCSQGQAK